MFLTWGIIGNWGLRADVFLIVVIRHIGLGCTKTAQKAVGRFVDEDGEGSAAEARPLVARDGAAGEQSRARCQVGIDKKGS